MKTSGLYSVREISSLRDMLDQSEARFGSKNAFLSKDNNGNYKGITYKDFKKDVQCLAVALSEMGLNDSFVSLTSENRYEWCVTYLAVVNYLGVIVPIDKELKKEEKGNLIRRSESKAVIFSGKYEDEIKATMNENKELLYAINMDIEEDTEDFISFKSLIKLGESKLQQGSYDLLEKPMNNEKMSILLYTSGTTDLAKGVMLSQKNICSNILNTLRTVHVDHHDVTLSILPLHHTYECTFGFLTMIYCGATVAFNEGLKHIMKNLKEVRPTLMITVPLILENMYKRIYDQAKKKRGLSTLMAALKILGNGIFNISRIDIRKKLFKKVLEGFGGRLRLIFTGAAAISPDVSKGFRSFGVQVLQGYGLTECSPLVLGNRDSAFKDSSVGLNLPGVEVKLNNPDEHGVGEIIVRGENVMLGYFKNQEATEKILKDGWFYTGDLAKKDKKGFYYITGRIKNVIVTKGGKKIFPEEVEEYINRSPYVKESLVWGAHDSLTGEITINAQVFPNIEEIKQRLKSVNVSADEIFNTIKEVIKGVNLNMPLYKRVHNFSVRENEFIKTTTQKIKRYIDQNKN